jgi:hypothetical protein
MANIHAMIQIIAMIKKRTAFSRKRFRIMSFIFLTVKSDLLFEFLTIQISYSLEEVKQ